VTHFVLTPDFLFFFDTWFSGSTSFSVFLYLRKLWRYTGKGLNQRMRLLQTGNTEMSSLNLEAERWKHMVRGHDRHMWLYCIVSFLNKHQYWKISVNLTKMTGFSLCIFSFPNNAWVLHYSAHAIELDILWHSDDNLLSMFFMRTALHSSVYRMPKRCTKSCSIPYCSPDNNNWDHIITVQLLQICTVLLCTSGHHCIITYTESQSCNSVCVFTWTHVACLKIDMVPTFVISLLHDFDSESYKLPGYLLTSKHAASMNIQIALSCHFSLPKIRLRVHCFL